MAGEIITVTTTVAAHAPKAWACFTEPSHITKWNFASDDWHCPTATNDLKVGGEYLGRMEAKNGSFGFDFKAVYDEIVTNEKIAYTMEDGRKANIIFTTSGNNTEVSIAFDAEQFNPVEMQKAGWQAILDNYKKHVESC
ncbi:MAG: SRPBCC family protein [Chitinophagaceae bacterium]|nr:SRPBCC family protein [Chitinophagaceae bacterium]